MSPAQTITSPYMGCVSWDPSDELVFPAGLPGFEQERRMLPVEIPAHRPLVYLQSLDRADICFLTLPVFTIDPSFSLHLSDDERQVLQLGQHVADEAVPAIGVDVLCLAMLVPRGKTVEANLNAPVVINLHNSRAIQSVASGVSARVLRLSDAGTWEIVC